MYIGIDKDTDIDLYLRMPGTTLFEVAKKTKDKKKIKIKKNQSLKPQTTGYKFNSHQPEKGGTSYNDLHYRTARCHDSQSALQQDLTNRTKCREACGLVLEEPHWKEERTWRLWPKQTA